MVIKEFFDHFLWLVFPQTCVGCNEALSFGEVQICSKCRITIPKTTDLQHVNNPLHERFAGRVDFQYAMSYLGYSKKNQVQRYLKQLKYASNEDLGVMLGSWFGQELTLNGFKHSFDVLIPVPLHKQKLNKRGYNQSLALCQGLSQYLSVMVNDQAVQRTVNTISQTKFSKEQRWKNVENIFKVVDDHALRDQRVALVDDVVTTGATIETLANAILPFKPASISLLCLADANRT